MTHIPSVACARCSVEMQRENGKLILATTTDKAPYYVISADVFRCARCDAFVIAAWAQQPVAMDYQEDFDKWVARSDYTVHLEP